MRSDTEIQQMIANEPDESVIALLETVPARWGRMTPLSRLLIVETGLILQKQGLLKPGERLNERGCNVGLIGGTGKGSIHTDLAFIKTMTDGPGLASPALFGYTLPNIPLAEAAVTFGLTGPVYALFASAHLLKSAEREAHCLLEMQSNLDFMLACEFDHYSVDGQTEQFFVTLTVVE